MRKKGISLNSVEKFLSHCADKIRRITLLKVFRKNCGIEIFQAKEGEASRFSSHRTEKTSPGNHFVF